MDRPILGLDGLTGERAVYLGILLLAVALRFWDLGQRMLHHDESIHAVWSWYLYVGRGYRHDPIYHGPFLYHATALVYFLIGATDYATRVAPAVFGTLMVALPYLLRSHLGRYGALATSSLLALSPSILYYSRSLRHDIFAATATLALVVALWRYQEDQQPRWLYLAAAGLALSFTNHELSYITAAILVIYLLFIAGPDLLARLADRRLTELSPAAAYLLFLGSIVGPLSAAMVLVVTARLGMPLDGLAVELVLWGTYLALLAGGAVLGLWWNRRLWLAGMAIFYAIFGVLYTSVFSNPEGFGTGAIGALRYWLTQHTFARGAQPWYYYLLLFPLYDFLPIVFALGGAVLAFWRRHHFALFLLYWSLASLLIYSWAGEKMPWLVIHIALPFCVLAGWALGRLTESIPWRPVVSQGGIYLVLGLGLMALVLLALANLGFPGPHLPPIQQQQRLFQWLALFAVWASLAVAVFVLAQRLGGLASGQMVAVAVFGVLLAFTVHAGLQVNFRYGDVPVEMLVYTQTSPDVGKVMREVERIGFRTGAGKELKVAYDDKVSWPFEWYLRDYTGRNYYGNGLPAADAPVVLVGFEGDHDARVRLALGTRYVGQRYKLRWWFPEDYKSAQAWIRAMQSDEMRARSPSAEQVPADFVDLLQASVQPSGLNRLWKYFLYRETFSPLGSTDFMVYVQRDLVDGLWGLTATTGPVTAEDQQYVEKTRTIAAVQAWGTFGGEEGQFREPKAVAVGPDGSIYVADTRNHRVQKLDSQGKFLLQWGGQGSGDGQFAEPWGIAVGPDGSVYVADTWNHRIQKFDSQGKFLLSWGRGIARGPGEFYGPRGLAVDTAGQVFVADTGNHRLQRFDANGQFIAEYGTRGSGDGQFNEPVGVAVDPAGQILVADTWNRRVQKLDSQFRPVGQWSVAGWQSQSLVNKPYLAVDAEGNVYASDPENHRLLQFGPGGSIKAVWGKLGSDLSSFNLPTGAAVDGSGNLLVADSLNHRIMKFAPVR